MRRLDRGDARLVARGAALGPRVGGEQPFFNQEADKRRGFGRNVGAAGDVAARIFCARVDAGEPGDEAAPQ